MVERGIRENHTPAESVIRLVALKEEDLVRRIGLLHQDGKIQTGRTAAQADNAHGLFVILNAHWYK